MSAPSIRITDANEGHSYDPDWILPENDDRHRESLPLFGSGSPSLQDPEDDNESTAFSSISLPKQVSDLFKKPKHKKNKKRDYGTSLPPRDVVDDDDISAIDNVPSVGGGSATTATAAAGRPHVPRQNPCLWIFHFVQFTACVSSICLVATQVIPVIMVPGEVMTRMGALSLALKVYVSVFCVAIIIVEADLPVPWIQQSPLMTRFFSRGFIYSFIGLVCVEESYSERIRDIVHQKDQFQVGWAAIFMQISSWLMLGIGFIYMILGMFCLKRLRDRLKQKEITEWKQYRRDLKEWKDLHE
ncbi:hypothetical protein MPSEU_000154400 [Mayamaea pseudoterrestris]|nr:hypothetical protein MPSEU_000154400 [Mayamaea pseudoterrestris]